MSHSSNNPPILPPWPDLPVNLNGIHDGIYDQARHYWNTLHSVPFRSLYFFSWCLRNWMQFRALYESTAEDNFEHLFEAPYEYFLAMVIVGANSELERFRYEWSEQDFAATVVIGFLMHTRNDAAQYWPEPLLFSDSESEYYAEANIDYSMQ